MKKAIAWVGAEGFYWLGHGVSLLLNLSDQEPLAFMAKLYPLYNRLMIWSGKAQKWGGLDGPWVEVKPK